MSAADAANGACPPQAGSEQVRNVLASRLVRKRLFIGWTPTYRVERGASALSHARDRAQREACSLTASDRRGRPEWGQAPQVAAAAPTPNAGRRSPAAGVLGFHGRSD